mgnify:CR=1 FL=1
MVNKNRAFTLIELLVVVAIIGTLSAVGVVAYNGYTKSAKAKTAELNYSNINKALMFEFMKCELDSSATVFNNHNCGNSNSPPINTISNFITNNLKITMRCAKSNIPMAIEDQKNGVYGFQFHPESFLTENGNTIIKKILSA